jgi:putative aldouronate transport system permease protein
MFFSGGLIPTYLIIKSLNGIDKFWVMVIPGCISAYNIIVFRTFFDQQPQELRESAIIDGANDLIIWARIIIPLSKPLLATFALFGIVGHWNSWFPALLYLRDSSKYPLQMLLRKLIIREDLTGGYADDEIAVLVQMGKLNPKNMQMAAIVVTMLPILCIYPFIQKYFVKGVMIGAIKG